MDTNFKIRHETIHEKTRERTRNCTKVLLISCLFVFIFVWFSVSASEARAITVSPAKIEITADPGSVVDSQMQIFNETNARSCFSPSAEKFTESEGRRVFLSGEKSLLAEWTKVPSKVCVEPGEREYIPFVINIPNDAPPGGHFAVFWWGDVPKEGAGSVGISVRAGILVYLRINGAVDETSSVTGFKPVKRFIFGLPAEFTWGFENHGNVHLKPKGTITVRNMFGWTRQVININENSFFVLPDGKRTWTEAWTSRGPFTWGPYIATLRVKYGEAEPKEYKKSRFVLYLPWKQSLILLFILLIFGYLLPKFIRRYNEKVIARYQARFGKLEREEPEQLKEKPKPESRRGRNL